MFGYDFVTLIGFHNWFPKEDIGTLRRYYSFDGLFLERSINLFDCKIKELGVGISRQDLESKLAGLLLVRGIWSASYDAELGLCSLKEWRYEKLRAYFGKLLKGTLGMNDVFN